MQSSALQRGHGKPDDWRAHRTEVEDALNDTCDTCGLRSCTSLWSTKRCPKELEAVCSADSDEETSKSEVIIVCVSCSSPICDSLTGVKLCPVMIAQGEADARHLTEEDRALLRNWQRLAFGEPKPQPPIFPRSTLAR